MGIAECDEILLKKDGSADKAFEPERIFFHNIPGKKSHGAYRHHGQYKELQGRLRVEVVGHALLDREGENIDAIGKVRLRGDPFDISNGESACADHQGGDQEIGRVKPDMQPEAEEDQWGQEEDGHRVNDDMVPEMKAKRAGKELHAIGHPGLEVTGQLLAGPGAVEDEGNDERRQDPSFPGGGDGPGQQDTDI